jgi:5-carboxymethyl-2-hydroxymuconic-semialdehyde dehydrogenase
VLADVDNRMRVAQEEIFGPVACLLPFKDEAEGCAWPTTWSTAWRRTSGPRTSAKCCAWRAISKGMVFVNTQNVRDLRQPFGGVKASGTAARAASTA